MIQGAYLFCNWSFFQTQQVSQIILQVFTRFLRSAIGVVIFTSSSSRTDTALQVWTTRSSCWSTTNLTIPLRVASFYSGAHLYFKIYFPTACFNIASKLSYHLTKAEHRPLNSTAPHISWYTKRKIFFFPIRGRAIGDFFSFPFISVFTFPNKITKSTKASEIRKAFHTHGLFMRLMLLNWKDQSTSFLVGYHSFWKLFQLHQSYPVSSTTLQSMPN